MMNLSRKRSASPSTSAQEGLDQLTAMHILKRQRLAAQTAAMHAHAEASLFGMHAATGMSLPSLYNAHMNNMTVTQAAAQNYMNMNMSSMPNMGMNAQLFHPGVSPNTSARLRSLSSTPMSPYSSVYNDPYSPNPMSGLPLGSHPLTGMPVLPTMPNARTPAAAAQAARKELERASSPSSGSSFQKNQDPPTTEAHPGLGQLSAFASHMPTMPLNHNTMKKKIATDAPASNNSDGELFLCGPVSSSGNNTGSQNSSKKSSTAPPSSGPSLPLKTIQTAKKLALPLMDEAQVNQAPVHWKDRPFAPLAIHEDANWLSEFQCFLRSEILEVFVASPRDLETRAVAGASKKKIAATQVGIRCRFCAHLHSTERASRASAFPSSVRQIYQSFTMMLREHLNGQCEAFPADIKQHFLKLKGHSAQSASDSKRYWIYAAQKLGMVDTPEAGIQMNPQGQASTAGMQPFGASPQVQADLQVALHPQAEPLAVDVDQPVASEFTYTVVSQAVKVHLAASEKIGNRSCLTVGLPGLACKHCALAGRSGLSRVFPARKRNLKTKVHDLYDHLRRCDLVPPQVQHDLQRMAGQAHNDKRSKVFYARLWRRLGHTDAPTNETKSPVTIPGSEEPVVQVAA